MDDSSIRRKHRTDLKRAKTTYEKARTEWQQYQEVTLPSYHKWRVRAEGALAFEIQTVTTKNHELITTAQNADLLATMTGLDFGDAYRLSEDIGNHPEKYANFFEEMNKREEKARSGPFGFDDDDSDAFEEAFKDVMDRMFGEEFEDSDEFHHDDDENEEGGTPFDQASENDGRPSAMEAGKGSPSKVKSLFREIVKLLHPDRATDLTDADRQLWHQVQEAYQKEDSDFLEVALAHVRLRSNDPVDMNCGMLASLRAFYEDARKSLRKTLRAVRYSDAWRFGRMNDQQRMEEGLRIQRTMQTALKDAKHELSEMEQHIQWVCSELEFDFEFLSSAIQQGIEYLEKEVTRRRRANARSRKKVGKKDAEGSSARKKPRPPPEDMYRGFFFDF